MKNDLAMEILRPKNWWSDRWPPMGSGKRPYIIMATHQGKPVEIREIIGDEDEDNDSLVQRFMRKEGRVIYAANH